MKRSREDRKLAWTFHDPKAWQRFIDRLSRGHVPGKYCNQRRRRQWRGWRGRKGATMIGKIKYRLWFKDLPF